MGEGDDSGLDECREAVEQLQLEKQALQQENEVLRVSAEDFGELAERLEHRAEAVNGAESLSTDRAVGHPRQPCRRLPARMPVRRQTPPFPVAWCRRPRQAAGTMRDRSVAVRRAEHAVVVVVHQAMQRLADLPCLGSTPGRPCPPARRSHPRVGGGDRAGDAAAVVAGQHVQLRRHQRAEHRRRLVLADLAEPCNRLQPWCT